MRRSVLSRALLAAWGFWFTAVVSAPAGFHSCPTHGDHVASAHHGAPAMSHAAHASQGSKDAGNGHTECTCLGPCCCGAPVVPPEPVHEVLAVVLVDVPASEYLDVARPSVDRAYLNPLANGPPAAV